MQDHAVVVKDRWLIQRKALLAREKELTRLSDEIARERRALPWLHVDKHYVFDTPDGPRALADLFEGRRQLLVQHFMLGPGWQEGCRSCSFMADHVDGIEVHLQQRDMSFVAISRAPIAEIEQFRRRMGWKFKWASSHRNDFNQDFDVSFTPEQMARGEIYYNFHMTDFMHDELPGLSVFYKDDVGTIFHTYSAYGRGVEAMMGAYRLLDLLPKGRDEEQLSYGMAWVRHHDRYDAAPKAAGCCAGSAATHPATPKEEVPQ
ncbi:DUF899 domain-containing protein [Variovorax dokdonensis]